MSKVKESISESNSYNIHSPIKDWREDDRPREKLIKYGASKLTDSEIIAILLGSGTIGKSAIDVSRALLKEFSTISNMAKCSTSEFTKVSGIGQAKAILLSAAFELSRRIQENPFEENRAYTSIYDIAQYYIHKLRDLRVETFRVILLNAQYFLIREIIISEGILTGTLVHPREVFRNAILESAASMILLHNHPSGSVMPSQEDKIITKKLVETGDIVGINVLDHIIIGGKNYSSFKQLGLI